MQIRETLPAPIKCSNGQTAREEGGQGQIHKFGEIRETLPGLSAQMVSDLGQKKKGEKGKNTDKSRPGRNPIYPDLRLNM